MTFLRRALREPLLHFLAAGLLLFVAGQALRERSNIRHIVVTPQREAQLANRYALQFGGRPDAGKLAELVQADVHEEILFREGLALGLDKEDEIVRRRIIQKMRFLLEDRQVPPEPTAAQLQTYYNAHSEQYWMPPRATFTHVFFLAGADAGSRADAALAALAARGSDRAAGPDRDLGLGDPFPDRYDFADYSPAQVEHLFGRSDFTARVFSVPTGQWAGPFRSAYGWHLIYVQAREAGREEPFAAAREQVRVDFLLADQKVANERAFSALARQFTVARN